MMMIRELFDFSKKEMAVMVGGGGKTTLINRLAYEYSLAGKTAIITTTTKILPPQGLEYGLLLVDEMNDFQHQVMELRQKNKIIVAGRQIDHDGKIVGLNQQQVNNLECLADIVLVEGDGAKGKPFKAPRQWEPVIPQLVSLVVPVVGIECIGRALSEENFHSVEQICILTGLKVGDAVQEEAIAKILLDPQGYKKNVPSGARWIPFINKVESHQDRKKVLLLSNILKSAGVEKILFGSAGILGEIEVY